MPKRLELKGKIFGRLTVIELAGTRNHQTYWKCKCDCGNEVTVVGYDLKSGHTKSCSCLQKDINIKRSTVHGLWGTPAYISWSHMIQRCTNPKDKKYKNYGQRGITVCPEWFEFNNFYRDMGECPQGLTIDRKDNNKGYYKENCHWATSKEQANNTRRNHFLTFDGKTQTISQWAREKNINCGSLVNRIDTYHWTIERALTESYRPIARLVPLNG